LGIEGANTQAQLKQGLRALRDLLESYENAPEDSNDIARFECRIESAPDLLSWLPQTPNHARLYWRHRTGLRCVAGWGVADTVKLTGKALKETLERLHQRLKGAPANARYFGGVAFDHEGIEAKEWAGFGRARFWLPRVTVERENNDWTVAVHLLNGDTQSARRELEALINHTGAARHASVTGGSVQHEPNLTQWTQGIHQALGAFAQGDLHKVVLARRSQLSLQSPPDVFSLFKPLSDLQNDTTHFILQPDGGTAFIGCTPERLFSREARTLLTEALAGTRPRAADPEQDDALATSLLQSQKERNEHALVVDHIFQTLQMHCKSLRSADEPAVKRLRNVQHLHTPFEAELNPTTTDAELLAALHPTPAVCGLPVEAARDFIRQQERFGRGWYAGPIGWVSDHAAEIHVAIRSALVSATHLWAYAGSGIVPGSDPIEEWAEVERKSQPFSTLLEYK